MIIQWDVDGVLANFDRAYHALANEMFGLSIPLEHPPTWDWLEDTIGSDRVGRIWNHIKQDGSFWSELPLQCSAKEIARVAALDEEHTNYFVTSRVGKNPKIQTEYWLEKHGIVDPTVIVSSRKADAANALKAHYTIDDKAGNVLAVYYNSPPERHVYVYDTPYNQFDSRVVGSRVRRVNTVSAFLDDIEAGR